MPDRDEQAQRTLRAIDAQDRHQDAQAVAPGVELRCRAFRPRVVGRAHLGDRHFKLQRMDGELGLDLEAAGEDRKRFHEAAREHAIARQHVGEGLSEDARDESGQHAIAGAVARPVGRLLAVDAHRHDHVERAFDQPRDHLARARRVVGRVAVDQHVHVRVDVGEHAPHHVALALMRSRAAPPRRPRARRRPCRRSSCCRRRTQRNRAAPRGTPRPRRRSLPPRCSRAPARRRDAQRARALAVSASVPVFVVSMPKSRRKRAKLPHRWSPPQALIAAPQ